MALVIGAALKTRLSQVASMSWVLTALRSIRVSRLGVVLSGGARRPGGVGRGKGIPNSVVEDGCTLTKISYAVSSLLTYLLTYSARKFRRLICELGFLCIARISPHDSTEPRLCWNDSIREQR